MDQDDAAPNSDRTIVACWSVELWRAARSPASAGGGTYRRTTDSPARSWKAQHRRAGNSRDLASPLLRLRSPARHRTKDTHVNPVAEDPPQPNTTIAAVDTS